MFVATCLQYRLPYANGSHYKMTSCQTHLPLECIVCSNSDMASKLMVTRISQCLDHHGHAMSHPSYKSTNNQIIVNLYSVQWCVKKTDLPGV